MGAGSISSRSQFPKTPVSQSGLSLTERDTKECSLARPHERLDATVHVEENEDLKAGAIEHKDNERSLAQLEGAEQRTTLVEVVGSMTGSAPVKGRRSVSSSSS